MITKVLQNSIPISSMSSQEVLKIYKFSFEFQDPKADSQVFFQIGKFLDAQAQRIGLQIF